jgi:hypothetical protein
MEIIYIACLPRVTFLNMIAYPPSIVHVVLVSWVDDSMLSSETGNPWCSNHLGESTESVESRDRWRSYADFMSRESHPRCLLCLSN